nr:MAG TPA: hypothetical protein [Caudoviricetes sp.]
MLSCFIIPFFVIYCLSMMVSSIGMFPILRYYCLWEVYIWCGWQCTQVCHEKQYRIILWYCKHLYQCWI